MSTNASMQPTETVEGPLHVPAIASVYLVVGLLLAVAVVAIWYCHKQIVESRRIRDSGEQQPRRRRRPRRMNDSQVVSVNQQWFDHYSGNRLGCPPQEDVDPNTSAECTCSVPKDDRHVRFSAAPDKIFNIESRQQTKKLVELGKRTGFRNVVSYLSTTPSVHTPCRNSLTAVTRLVPPLSLSPQSVPEGVKDSTWQGNSSGSRDSFSATGESGIS
ncbi:predicted protein [Nematostella vectensis]|uniref:Uncharacterized protein n=1 Tax=Nematostella vectensis TaxID=45351 RepID=A7RG37_NEMVE|nr:predicted protein [Nematostella vectensis]|eukprot:XP_001641528.1 predicted protein [Nematostella vectensis]